MTGQGARHHGRILNGLVTDETTAQAILALD